MLAVSLDPSASGLDRLRLTSLPRPAPGSGEVLVDVQAVSLSSWEQEAVTMPQGLPLRLKARPSIPLGLEFAGILSSDGERLRRGDRVVGSTHLLFGGKAMAEQIAVSEDLLVPLPDEIPLTEGAVLPVTGATALRAIDRLGRTLPSDRVLVVGASGGVGVFATQIAAARGALVTGIGSGAWLEQAASFGVTHAYDYRTTMPAALGARFDLVLDLPGTMTARSADGLLTPRGTFISASPVEGLRGAGRALCRSQRSPVLWVPYGRPAEIRTLLAMRATGKLRPGVHGVVPVTELREAFATLSERGIVGRLVLDTSTWPAPTAANADASADVAQRRPTAA